MLRLPPRQRPSRRVEVDRECPAHRAWVRRHHCSVPGCRQLPVECAHVRTGTNGGTALKPSDGWVISLCRHHHAEQHRVGETTFADRYGLDLLELAEEFCRRSPHADKLRACSKWPSLTR
jgi:hypothetical protein